MKQPRQSGCGRSTGRIVRQMSGFGATIGQLITDFLPTGTRQSQSEPFSWQQNGTLDDADSADGYRFRKLQCCCVNPRHMRHQRALLLPA